MGGSLTYWKCWKSTFSKAQWIYSEFISLLQHSSFWLVRIMHIKFWWLASDHYSENARMCAKWQWKARDCVNWIRRSCNPVTLVKCVFTSIENNGCNYLSIYLSQLIYVPGVLKHTVITWYTCSVTLYSNCLFALFCLWCTFVLQSCLCTLVILFPASVVIAWIFSQHTVKPRAY